MVRARVRAGVRARVSVRARDTSGVRVALGTWK